MDNFTPFDVFEKTLKHWWFLAILILFGGLVGGLIHFLRPPLYDAQAVISAGLDFTQTGPLEEINIDYAMNMVGTLISSTQVKDRVSAQMQSQQIGVRPGDLHQYLERKHNTWVLHVRYLDPQIAAEMANLWADEAYAQLQDASLHAQRAHGLRAHQTALEDCIQGAAGALSSPVPCSIPSFDQIQSDLASTDSALEAEIKASRNISPALTFDLSERAVGSTQSSSRGTNAMVLAGGMIGFLIGIASIYNDLPGRLTKVLRRG